MTSRPRKLWTTHEKDAMVADYTSGMPMAAVRTKYGVDDSTLYYTLKKRGIPPHAAVKMTGANGIATQQRPALPAVAAPQAEIERAPLPTRVRPGEKKPFRVRLLVSLGIQAVNMEEALAIARDYNGMIEVLSISRRD